MNKTDRIAPAINIVLLTILLPLYVIIEFVKSPKERTIRVISGNKNASLSIIIFLVC